VAQPRDYRPRHPPTTLFCSHPKPATARAPPRPPEARTFLKASPTSRAHTHKRPPLPASFQAQPSQRSVFHASPRLSPSRSVHIRLPKVPNTSSDTQIRTRLTLKYLPLAGRGLDRAGAAQSRRRPTSQSYEALRSRNSQRGASPRRVQMVAEEASHCSRRRS
jgi:hypothetical protein